MAADMVDGEHVPFARLRVAALPRRALRCRPLSSRPFAAQRERDSESGLQHNRARAYDPRTGRFVQMEPMLASRIGKPYVYASNNPSLLTDPSGFFTIGKWGYKPKGHEVLTGGGLKGIFTSVAIDTMIIENINVDFPDNLKYGWNPISGMAGGLIKALEDYHSTDANQPDHFLRRTQDEGPAGNLSAVSEALRRMKGAAQEALDLASGNKAAPTDRIWTLIGKLLHTLQDSYSHTDREPETSIGVIAVVYAYIPGIRGSTGHNDEKDYIWKNNDKKKGLTRVASAAQDATKEFAEAFLGEVSERLDSKWGRSSNLFTNRYSDVVGAGRFDSDNDYKNVDPSPGALDSFWAQHFKVK